MAYAARAETESQKNRRAVAGVFSKWRSLSIYEKTLLVLFVLSLLLVNPWVRGDGVGYYAYLRSLLIDHDLNFENDYLMGNPSFVLNKLDASGHLSPTLYTPAGRLGNNFSVGPSILWAPFVVGAHGVVLMLDRLGAHIPANGYSRPYVVALAAATALYGFLGLFLSFRLAGEYFAERWAFLATLGIWFAGSLPVYMYLNPAWSHAQSVFGVALFLWYWHRTRGERTLRQWILLGLITGLMINVYYVNGVVLLIPALEALGRYARIRRQPEHRGRAAGRLVLGHLVFLAVSLIALLPTFITRTIIYGSPLETGYPSPAAWHWTSPALWSVLFSSFHGLLSWTPILIPAVVGLFLWPARDRELGAYFLLTFLLYYLVIASRPDWQGISSFGNRYFISMTPIFVFGLAAFLERLSQNFVRTRTAWAVAGLGTALLVVWNVGFIFQWGTQMIPARGPISWGAMARNQVTSVPVQLTHTLKTYFLRRRALMEKIEAQDVKRMGLQLPRTN